MAARLLKSAGSQFETSWGVALWAIAAAAILFLLDFAATILLPTAYAIVLALVLAPIARALSRLKIGDGASAVITVFFAAAAIICVIAVIAPVIGDWINNAPTMARAIDRKLQPLKDQLQIVENVSNRISGEKAGAPAVAAGAGGMLGSILSMGANFASQTIYVLFLTIFLLSLRTDLRKRFILCSDDMQGRCQRARAVRDVGRNVAAYLFILTCINVGVAIVTAAAFYAAGIADPIVWGAIYGLANYVPIIGPTGTILAAAVVGVATEPTLLGGLTGATIMLVINAIESQAIQPWLMARRIELNPVALFISLAFVVWLWGVPAAIISAPLLITLYTFARHTPALHPIAAVLAPVTKPRHPPPPVTPLRMRRRAERAERRRAARVESASAA
ncbi:MAG: AI-2E family transporter [Alphaproteobacteria bacterium]|nr:AI-2E family transporter [Alphaproteobacteria bacterium]